MLFKQKKRIIAYIESCINKFFALIILIFLSPLLLIISCTCLYLQGLPLLYKSQRIGKNGNHFTLYKFRSMKIGTADDQSRITEIGRFLRRSSLDELPQLINILKGEMGLIGPRPLPDYCFKTKLMKRYLSERHRVLPGLTGLAQAMGKGIQRSQQKKLIFDIYYVRNKSTGLDFYVIFKTMIAICHRISANKRGLTL